MLRLLSRDNKDPHSIKCHNHRQDCSKARHQPKVRSNRVVTVRLLRQMDIRASHLSQPSRLVESLASPTEAQVAPQLLNLISMCRIQTQEPLHKWVCQVLLIATLK